MKPSGTKEPANLEWDALVRALNGDEALAQATSDFASREKLFRQSALPRLIAQAA